MHHRKRWIIVILLILAALQLAACGRAPTATATNTIEPATIEPSGEFNKVILTEKAAQRLDVQTAPVREEQVDGTQRKVVPYAALIYGNHGETWVYASYEPLTFVREPITVDYIEGDTVVLMDGPATGTEVATVAVAELYGTDTGVGK